MPGTVYIRLLTLTILPLIASNVMCGELNCISYFSVASVVACSFYPFLVIADLNLKENGKVSLITLIYTVVANALGAAFGLIFALIIRPGKWDPNCRLRYNENILEPCWGLTDQ